jgi:hypothetical protein
MRARAFDRIGEHGRAELGYSTDLMLGNLLDVLTPNQLMEGKFREGYRAAMCKRDRRPCPSDLYRVAACIKALRTFAAVAFATVGALGPVTRMIFELRTGRALDDDGWLFLVKPVLDGMTDAGCWPKDRRVLPYLGGFVSRESSPVDVLAVNVYLL